MQSVTMAGLVKIELPDVTIRICDGAFVIWDAETFESADDDFGTIGAIESAEEGTGDEIPAMRMVFLPKSAAAAADLSQAEFQRCRVRSWTVEVDLETNEVTGTPNLEFVGQVDMTDFVTGIGSRELEMEIVAEAERCFLIDEGNTLSPRFHKLLYPGELGEDNATGLGGLVAWGTSLPAQTYGPGYGGGGQGGGNYGGGKLNFADFLQ